MINKGTEYTVYTRGVFKTFKVYNEEALLHESLKAGGGMGAGANSVVGYARQNRKDLCEARR